MSLTTKWTPKAELFGIRDESKRQLPVEPRQLPQHLPVLFLLTEKSEEIAIVGGTGAQRKYGEKTFDPNSDYFNHQSVLASLILPRNQAMVVPIKFKDAKKATLRLSAEVVACTVDTKHVTRVIWHAEPIPEGDEDFMHGKVNQTFRQGSTNSQAGTTQLGKLIDQSDQSEWFVPSAKIPIMDFQTEYRGEAGNDYALSIYAPDQKDKNPPDTYIMYGNNARIYRCSLYKKLTKTSNPRPIWNNYSEIATDCVLNPEFVNRLTNLRMDIGYALTESYQEIDDQDKAPIYGPFPDIAVYQENVEMLAMMLGYKYEVDAVDATSSSNKKFEIAGIYDTEEEATEKRYLIDIFTGIDIEGNPYPNVDYKSSRKFGGVRLGKDSLVFATGGSNGFPTTNGTVDKVKTLEQFDLAVRDFCDSYTDANPIYDPARYPFGAVWDSGFSMGTKEYLLKPMGQHKRIATILATHAVADYADPTQSKDWHIRKPLTAAEEVSVGTMLSTRALLYPESELYGTPTVRCAIVAGSGELINKMYRGHLPLTLELAYKTAKYMGSGDAIWDPASAMDVYPNNKVELFKNINVTYQSYGTRNKYWEAGLTYVQHDDVKSTFFPAIRTVYPDPTSILTNYINMMGCCYVERICDETWKYLVGNTKLTDQEFIEESNKLIAQACNGKFDNRFKIVPETFYTSADKLSGFQWSCNIYFYGPNMKTVGKFTVVARRMADYVPKAA